MSQVWILLDLRLMEVVSGDNWSYKTCKAPVKLLPSTNQHPHTHTNSVLTAIFPGETGLAGCPQLLHLFLDCTSFWDRPKSSMSFLTQSHRVFFGRPLCLIPSTSHIIQRLTQSLSSFRSTCPNHLNLLFLIIKLTCSNPKSSLEFFTFLPLIQLKPTHPSDHTHFSAIQLQFMLYFTFSNKESKASLLFCCFQGHQNQCRWLTGKTRLQQDL